MTLDVRANDAAECRAFGYSPKEAVEHCVARSDTSAQEYINGELAAVWGWRLRGFLTQNIDAWLLSMEVVTAHPIEFARRSRRALNALLARHPSIFVEVHSTYTDSVKWLLWLGFKGVGARTVGGETFLLMQRDRD